MNTIKTAKRYHFLPTRLLKVIQKDSDKRQCGNGMNVFGGMRLLEYF